MSKLDWVVNHTAALI